VRLPRSGLAAEEAGRRVGELQRLDSDPLVTDPRLPVASFTGSGAVGRRIRDLIPRKHVTLALGGNAAVAVCADWDSPADLERAVGRIAAFGVGQAGQSCISVQRVLADRSIFDLLLDLVLTHVRTQVVGDPELEETTLAPMSAV
jgi:aldehyde dehydrogenase (NAD+)/glyceraldehyde-3-phosphate dehydrogenase (NADP+)